MDTWNYEMANFFFITASLLLSLIFFAAQTGAKEAEAFPKAARLIGKTDEDIRVDINITPPKNNIFDISKISVEDGSNIRFQLEKRDTAGSRNFIIHVFNTKPDAGRYVDRITMTTTSTISPELTVRVFGIIRD